MPTLEEVLELQPSKIYTRMRPYRPKHGQPHKSYALSPLSLRFQAGEFREIKLRVANYIADIYPEKDIFRPPLFEFFTYEQMIDLRRKEVQEERARRQAELLGEEYRPEKLLPKRKELPSLEDAGISEVGGLSENKEMLSLKEEIKGDGKVESNPFEGFEESEELSKPVDLPPEKEAFEKLVLSDGEELEFEAPLDEEEPEEEPKPAPKTKGKAKTSKK